MPYMLPARTQEVAQRGRQGLLPGRLGQVPVLDRQLDKDAVSCWLDARHPRNAMPLRVTSFWLTT